MSKSVLNEPVSHFNNYFTAKPNGIVILEEWLTTDAYKPEIIALRKADKVERNKIKATLPAITVSGVFEPIRLTNNLKNHSGLICIDIDQQDNLHIPEITVFKKDFADLSEVAFCGLSASGNGLYIIMPIEIPELHRDYFIELEKIFKTAFNITIDKACKDVSRLRGVSYDQEFYINHNATTFKTLPKNDFKASIKPTYGDPDNNVVHNILKAVTSRKTDITTQQDDWFKICCVLANYYGEEGRKMFHLFSQYHAKYNKHECNKKYDYYLKHTYNYNIGTLVQIANEYGLDF